ncbi:MFS transporter [Streptomyces sp. NPDC056255]|uniref:MFS transporter n=1 Tax=Streptomyces sp. NPDC056255 TaxID=3345764 RepID=UPI0035D54F6A
MTQLLGGLGWHVVAIASALAGLWVFAIRAWVPESPYWLAAQDRHDEAAAVLSRLGATSPTAPASRSSPPSGPDGRWSCCTAGCCGSRS